MSLSASSGRDPHSAGKPRHLTGCVSGHTLMSEKSSLEGAISVRTLAKYLGLDLDLVFLRRHFYDTKLCPTM